MGGLIAVLYVAARFLFVPIFIVALPAWRGYHHEPVTWLLVWIPVMALLSAWIDTTFSASAGREKEAFVWEVAGVLMIAAMKLLIFIPVGAICFFGAALLNR